jgi:hypothetical protein
VNRPSWSEREIWQSFIESENCEVKFVWIHRWSVLTTKNHIWCGMNGSRVLGCSSRESRLRNRTLSIQTERRISMPPFHR